VTCPHTMCLSVTSLVLWLVTEHFHTSHRNYLWLEEDDDAYLSTYLHPLSFHTVAVKSPLTLVLMSPHFTFNFFSKSCNIPSGFGLTVLQLFVVFVCNLCPIYTITGKTSKFPGSGECPLSSVSKYCW